MKKRLPKYQYIDHTADVGIKIFGENLAELFENAAYGLFDIIANLDKVQSALEREITVNSTDLEALLVNWLSELNYTFLTRKELYSDFKVNKIDEKQLMATAIGEKLDVDRHEIYTEVKAVTYHNLYVKETKQGWEALVIFDL